MDKLERQRAVADAILLERAARVLKRRSPSALRNYVVGLERYAGQLRQEAEK